MAERRSRAHRPGGCAPVASRRRAAGASNKKLKDRPARRFLFRLALRCGAPHPDFLPELSATQLAEAEAYAEVEPWDEHRADLRMGIGWALLANLHRDSSKRPEPYRAEDFMPCVERAPEPPQRLWARLRSAFKLVKGD